MKNSKLIIAAALAVMFGLRAAAQTSVSGTLVETMDSGGYTYALLDTGTGKKWIATRPFKAASGEKITTGGGYEMKNFSSPTLNRKFDSIWFVSFALVGTNAPAAAANPHGGGAMMGGGHGGKHGGDSASGPGIAGEVVETMDAGGYTYLKVKGASETVWAATDKMEIKVGERVTVPPGELMKNFTSTKLNRTFDSIYFVSSVLKNGASPAAMKANPHGDKKTESASALTEAIAQPAGATSISEIIARKKELAGKEVTVKGKITKFTQRIMGRNWIHITDAPGTDLTVTTESYAASGDIVTVRGTVAVDQDFGYGYTYPVLIEKASLQK